MTKTKASLSLSVSAIVVLILAIVMLGLSLGFIRGMFGKVSAQLEQQISAEPEPPIPTASNPLTLSREVIITHAADKEIMKVSAYNPTNETWSSVKPTIDCSLSLLVSDQSANEKNVEQGKFVTFNLIMTIPNSAPDTHLCQVKLDPNKGYEKDLAIKIIE